MTLLFSLTLFISAALLFSVQPMIGKLILPKLGGTPAVWNTCMVFFQSALLLGYAYAHLLTSRTRTSRQVLFHLGLMLLTLLVLPIAVTEKAISSIPAETTPIPWLIGFLFAATGLPFVTVSATAPLLQKWFAGLRHRSSGDPYFLYSASNAGSMLGLLSYPLLIEPGLNLMEQSRFWAVGYGVLAVLIMICASVLFWSGKGSVSVNGNVSYANDNDNGGITGRGPDQGNDVLPHSGGGLSYRRMLRWVFLAFIPSSLMLGVTTHLTTDIAPLPLLWILPLSLYLLSFIMVFARRPLLAPPWLGRLLCICSVVLLVVFITGSSHPAWLLIILNLIMFSAAALIYHGELAKDRPESEYLTHFYLCMSAGGVLGGLFNALLAPLLFNNVVEYPLVMLLACAFRPVEGDVKRSAALILDTAWAAGIGMVTVFLILTVQNVGLDPGERLSTLGIFLVPALFTYRFVMNPRRFGLGLAAIMTASLLYTSVFGTTLLAERNFFGVLRVTMDKEGRYHKLVHGNTIHGRQSTDKSREGEALSYYHRTGPVGQVFDLVNSSPKSSSIGIIGLGAGSLAAYAGPSQDWTYYEINPAVERIALAPQFFSFLNNSRASTQKIVLGDARLRLKDAKSRQYDLIVIDAFSSDSIPMHLVTKEALNLYLDKLAEHGVLAFHISNRRLNLTPVFANLSHDSGLTGLSRNDNDISTADKLNGKEASEWVIMARNRQDLVQLLGDPRWEMLQPDPRVGVWRDDYSNILGVIRWRL